MISCDQLKKSDKVFLGLLFGRPGPVTWGNLPRPNSRPPPPPRAIQLDLSPGRPKRLKPNCEACTEINRTVNESKVRSTSQHKRIERMTWRESSSLNQAFQWAEVFEPGLDQAFQWVNPGSKKADPARPKPSEC